jgi:D-apiose dehydrogenase
MNSQGTTPLHIAIIGAGYFSQFHMMGWLKINHVKVVAVCDVHPDKAQQLAEKFNVPHWYTDVTLMLDTEHVDVVDIITPSATHRALVETMIKRRIPTVCQKPFGRSYAEARAMANAAEQTGVPLIVHENFRFMPWYREMEHRIATGLLGKLHGITFRLRPGDGQGALAYMNRQPYFQTMPRLLVQETGIHFIDTFRYLMGDITAVTARLRKLNPVIAGEDAALVVFEFGDGATGLLDANRLNDHRSDNLRRTMGEMWIEGERGVLQLDGAGTLSFRPHLGQETVLSYDKGLDDSFGNGACQHLQSHVVAHLLDGTVLENTAHDYLKNLLVQEAIYASHCSGQRIELSHFTPPSIPQIPFI